MSDSPPRATSLRTLIEAALALGIADRKPVLDDAERVIPFERMVQRNWVDAPAAAVTGQNLLLLTRRPLNAALALCSLDGVARRVVICPPDLAAAHLPLVVGDAQVSAIVHDGDPDGLLPSGVAVYPICADAEGYGEAPFKLEQPTEWALFTSGTTGVPKMAVHTLAGLTGAIPLGHKADEAPIIWSTFYDIRRYGGLQMLLRALTGGHTMMLTTQGEPMGAFLGRLETAGATHLSGTPSHWRSALMNPVLPRLSPRYVRLSGEIADQPVLDRLAAVFPDAAVGHAYASTEAGVGFEVTDGLEGFPAGYLSRPGAVEMRIEDGTLRIRSARAAHRYLGQDDAAPPLAGADGFVDTGDLVEQRGERLYFMGRVSGVINVGGLKVHPEEVEAVINRCAGVRMSLVKSRRNPITGAIVVAEVVLVDPALGQGENARATREAILDHCRATLTAYKVPASVKFVETLATTPGGKLERRYA